MGFKIYVYIGDRFCLLEVTRIKFCKLIIFVSVLAYPQSSIVLIVKAFLSKNNKFSKKLQITNMFEKACRLKFASLQFDIKIDILRVLTNIILTRMIKFMIFTKILVDFIPRVSIVK